MPGKVHARTERFQRAPQHHCYQSNSFNNFYNSFFVVVRPKDVRRSVDACKNVGANILNLPAFFSVLKISSDLHRSHEVSNRRLEGGPPTPTYPPPRDDVSDLDPSKK